MSRCVICYFHNLAFPSKGVLSCAVLRTQADHRRSACSLPFQRCTTSHSSETLKRQVCFDISAFQTIPLLQNTMASNFGGGGGGGSGPASGGGGYTGSGGSYPFLPPFGSTQGDSLGGATTPSLLVWPSKPFEVNTDLWRRLSAAPCASADHLLEKLNIYTPALAPYIGMTDVQVSEMG